MHRRNQHCHVAGGVQQRNNVNAFLCRIFKDGIHVALGQRCGICALGVCVGRIAAGNGILHGIIRVIPNGHIIQQEAQSIIAKSQLHMGIVIVCKLIDQVFDLVNTEGFAAAVQMEDAVESTCVQRTVFRLAVRSACGQAVGGSGGRTHQDAIFPGFLLGVLLCGGFPGGGLGFGGGFGFLRFLGGLLCRGGFSGGGLGFLRLPGGLLRHSGGLGGRFGYGGGLRFGGLLHLSNHGSLAFR